MLKIIIASFLLLHISLTDAAEVDITNVLSSLHTTNSDLIRANSIVADGFAAIAKPSWPETLACLAPNLTRVNEGYAQIISSLKIFTNALKQNCEKNPDTVYVPIEVIKANVDPIVAININFENIIASNLQLEFSKLTKVIRYSNGNAIIPVKNGDDIIATLNYIVTQYNDLTTDVYNWGKALSSLSDALKKSKSDFGALVFKQFSQSTVPLAYYNNLHTLEFKNVAVAYKNIFEQNSNGFFVASERDLNGATIDAMNNISINFYRIADLFKNATN